MPHKHGDFSPRELPYPFFLPLSSSCKEPALLYHCQDRVTVPLCLGASEHSPIQ